jgi:hypothetical protein
MFRRNFAPRGVTSQKTTFFIVTAVKTSNFTTLILFSHHEQNTTLMLKRYNTTRAQLLNIEEMNKPRTIITSAKLSADISIKLKFKTHTSRPDPASRTGSPEMLRLGVTPVPPPGQRRETISTQTWEISFRTLQKSSVTLTAPLDATERGPLTVRKQTANQ